jgi:hypothetical protein
MPGGSSTAPGKAPSERRGSITSQSGASVSGASRSQLKTAGERLNVSAAEKSHGGLVGAASVYFGSWRLAIKAAGFDYAKIKRQKEWSKAEIASEIKRMKATGLELGTTIPVRKRYRTLHAAAVRYFGSWAAAMKAAKLERLLKH